MRRSGSRSIIEFWARWHISLSGFITTYLYTPIVQSFRRVTLAKAMLATMIAMTIAGLWHGPSWTFVTFGVLHGAALATNSYWRKKVKRKMPDRMGQALTFAFVTGAFVFFRAPTMALALRMLHEAVTPHGAFSLSNLVTMRANYSFPIFGPPILIGLFVAFVGKSSEQLAREFVPTWRKLALCGVALAVACVYLNSQISASFIYFKF